jgi:hypothetical protein
VSLFRSVCKWQKSVKTVKDIVPSLKQVAAEVFGATMNRNPPSETRVSSNHSQPGHSLSVASSQQKQVQEEQNQINRQAREQEALIDEEERDLEEQEAVDSINNAILAAKARSRGARVMP